LKGSPDIAIVDCGAGNIHSIGKAVRRLAGGCSVALAEDPATIGGAGKVIFPGDGAFGECMARLQERKLAGALVEAAHTKPFLGICVGMQLLFEHSEEGDVRGLGVLPGEVKRFAPQEGLRIPHMGWNRVLLRGEHPALDGIEDGTRFYFIHCYRAQVGPNLTLASCEHGEEFSAIVGSGDLLAIQFHPEKSHRQGLRILENFLRG